MSKMAKCTYVLSVLTILAVVSLADGTPVCLEWDLEYPHFPLDIHGRLVEAAHVVPFAGVIDAATLYLRDPSMQRKTDIELAEIVDTSFGDSLPDDFPSLELLDTVQCKSIGEFQSQCFDTMMILLERGVGHQHGGLYVFQLYLMLRTRLDVLHERVVDDASMNLLPDSDELNTIVCVDSFFVALQSLIVESLIYEAEVTGSLVDKCSTRLRDNIPPRVRETAYRMPLEHELEVSSISWHVPDDVATLMEFPFMSLFI